MLLTFSDVCLTGDPWAILFSDEQLLDLNQNLLASALKKYI